MKKKKYDQGKLRWDLIPFDILKEIVKIYNFGVNKYGENTWQKIPNAKERYFAALMRHLIDWREGNKIDTESGLLHLAHAAWNIIALMYFDKNNFEEKNNNE